MAIENQGMVDIKSCHGRYLQANYPDGEMHASNSKRNEEETWFLYLIDKDKKVFGLMNWRNGKFMSKAAGGICAPANAQIITKTEKWVLVSGEQYGALNAVAFKSVADGTYLGSDYPDKDTPCGGEVASGDASAPPMNNGGWGGWWVMEPATAPTQGKDLWNTVGGYIAQTGQNIVNKISPADVAGLLKYLGAV